MKKINVVLLSVIGLFMTLAPINASAAVGFDKNGDSYCNNAAISGGGAFGTFATGDVCYKYTDEANGIKEWTFRLTPKTKLTTYYVEVQPSSTIEIQSIKAGSDFTIVDDTKTETGRSLLLFANNPSGVASGTKTVVFTVVTKDLAKEGCYLNIGPKSLNCANVNGNYFDKSGNQVSKDDYDKVCNGVTPSDPDEPNNPQTGSVVPYVAVAGGIVAIAGVYLFSRKSNKMYKI